MLLFFFLANTSIFKAYIVKKILILEDFNIKISKTTILLNL